MAEKIILKTQLRLVLDNGYDPETDKPLFKYKSFNNVRADVDPSKLYAVGYAFASLQNLTLDTIECNEQSMVAEQ